MTITRRGTLIPAAIVSPVRGCAAAIIAAVVWPLHPGVMAEGASARGIASVTASGPSDPPWT